MKSITKKTALLRTGTLAILAIGAVFVIVFTLLGWMNHGILHEEVGLENVTTTTNTPQYVPLTPVTGNSLGITKPTFTEYEGSFFTSTYFLFGLFILMTLFSLLDWLEKKIEQSANKPEGEVK